MRNIDFWLELAEDLKKPFYELAQEEDKSSTASTRRVIREYMDEAALELVIYIRSLPKPLREVIELKSIGLSWKAVMERLPDRVYYSVMDDYNASLRRIWTERDDLIRRLI